MKFHQLIVFLIISCFNCQQFNIHVGQESKILRMKMLDAIDAKLIHHNIQDGLGLNSICKVNEVNMELETQDIELISSEIVDINHFDPNKPIDLKQFISMIHIQDGIVALTSNQILYMLKFDYKEFVIDFDQQNGNSDIFLHETDDQLQPKFVSVEWKANLQQVFGIDQAIPQIVYSLEEDSLLFVFNEALFELPLFEIEHHKKETGMNLLFGFNMRDQRIQTKIIGGLLISSVGKDGIDIYRYPASDNFLNFITTINADTFWQGEKNTRPLIAMDMSVVKCQLTKHRLCILLYVIDLNRGILLIKIHENNQMQLNTDLLMIGIGGLDNPNSVETLNGKKVFASFNLGTNWVIQELLVDYQNEKQWSIIAEYKQQTRVVDIKMNEDFAIVQGQNHQQILLYGNNQLYKKYSGYHTISTDYGGIRDLDFFKVSHMRNQTKQQIKSFNDDFFIGITKHKLFITLYKRVPPTISCFTNDQNLLGKNYKYTIYYNTSKCPEIYKDDVKDCQKKYDFSVQVVQTIFYSDQQYIITIILISIILVMVFAFLYLWLSNRSNRVRSIELENQLQIYQSNVKQVQQGINQISMDQSIGNNIEEVQIKQNI